MKYCQHCGKETSHKIGSRIVGMKSVKTHDCKVCGSDEYGTPGQTESVPGFGRREV